MKAKVCGVLRNYGEVIKIKKEIFELFFNLVLIILILYLYITNPPQKIKIERPITNPIYERVQ